MTETTDAPAPAAPAPAAEQPPAENGENGTQTPTQAPEDAPKENAEPPKEMRAIVLNNFGGLKGVKTLKKPEPVCGEGEVLIRVKACGLNFQDLMVRQNALDYLPKPPFIMGFECAGEIEQIGEGVEILKVGDKVVALPEHKAWAELVSVPAKYVYVLPENMTPLDAVAITMNYLVAYILVFDMANVAPGKSVLLHSAGGGVGQAVAQLCKSVKDVTVFGVCSKAKHELLKESGNIDHLLERGSDYSGEIKKVSADGVDIVLDCLCGDECNRGYSLLKPMGKYILYGSSNVTGDSKSLFSFARSWWQVDKISPIKLFDENKTISGFNLRHLLYQHGGSDYIRSTMNKVWDLWQKGTVKPIVDSTWALEDVPEAMQKMHERKNIGKIVLDPSLEPKPKPVTPAKGKAGKDKKQNSTEEKKEIKEEKEKEEKKENGEKENGEKEKTEEKPQENGDKEEQHVTNGNAEENGSQ